MKYIKIFFSIMLLIAALILMSLLFFIDWSFISKNNSSVTLIISAFSAVATAGSAIFTARAANISSKAYKKHVDDEKPKHNDNVTVKKFNGNKNEYKASISVLNLSSLPVSYALKGFQFTDSYNISKRSMESTLSKYTNIDGKDTFKFLNDYNRDKFINIGSRQALEIAQLYVDLNSPIPYKAKYIQIIVQDFRKDNFNIPIEIKELFNF